MLKGPQGRNKAAKSGDGQAAKSIGAQTDSWAQKSFLEEEKEMKVSKLEEKIVKYVSKWVEASEMGQAFCQVWTALWCLVQPLRLSHCVREGVHVCTSTS